MKELGEEARVTTAVIDVDHEIIVNKSPPLKELLSNLIERTDGLEDLTLNRFKEFEGASCKDEFDALVAKCQNLKSLSVKDMLYSKNRKDIVEVIS